MAARSRRWVAGRRRSHGPLETTDSRTPVSISTKLVSHAPAEAPMLEPQKQGGGSAGLAELGGKAGCCDVAAEAGSGGIRPPGQVRSTPSAEIDRSRGVHPPWRAKVAGAGCSGTRPTFSGRRQGHHAIATSIGRRPRRFAQPGRAVSGRPALPDRDRPVLRSAAPRPRWPADRRRALPGSGLGKRRNRW